MDFPALLDDTRLYVAGGCLAVSLSFAGGFFIFANPIRVSLADIKYEAWEESIDRHRHYVTFPVDLNINAPRLGLTLHIEIGLAVPDDLPLDIESLMRVDQALIMPSLTEATRLLLEDPEIDSLEAFRKEFPVYVRDAMNRALATYEIPEPILEVLIQKLIATN